VPADKIVQHDWWQGSEVDGLRFTATPAQHFSGRSLRDGNRTLWASWTAEDRQADRPLRVFFSGDGGYFDGFAEIGRRFGPDVTLMETGATRPLALCPYASGPDRAGTPGSRRPMAAAHTQRHFQPRHACLVGPVRADPESGQAARARDRHAHSDGWSAWTWMPSRRSPWGRARAEADSKGSDLRPATLKVTKADNVLSGHFAHLTPAAACAAFL
jgi:L-ascorbate metabolism protein UlaG (beta-lactamase superfamily)